MKVRSDLEAEPFRNHPVIMADIRRPRYRPFGGHALARTVHLPRPTALPSAIFRQDVRRECISPTGVRAGNAAEPAA
ncbi:MAG: hypothetical protein K0R99_2343 [Microbacterium sp.]|jgi:hypothetical protein|nr:hypothetical protein [Microbacterium sp.]